MEPTIQRLQVMLVNKMDNNKKEIIEIFNDTYGKENSKMWFQRWRIFFLFMCMKFGMENEQSGVFTTDLGSNILQFF